MRMYERIGSLREKGELNPIYIEDDLRNLINFLPTEALTQCLHRYSMGRLELSEEQLEALISDIDTLKHNNIWDVDNEQQTIEQCKKSIEVAEAYKRLSASDKAKYDDAVKRDMERTFNIKIDF